MALTVQTEPLDLDALEADAERRLGELQEQRQRLAPEALTDADVAAELAGVDSEVRECEQALERVRLARVEQGRRAADAHAEEERARRAAAQAEADKLDHEFETDIAPKLDDALSELFKLTAALDANRIERARWSAEAGRAVSASWWQGVRIRLEAAWHFHAKGSGAPAGLLALEGAALSPRHWRRFAELPAEGDARRVEAKAE